MIRDADHRTAARLLQALQHAGGDQCLDDGDLRGRAVTMTRIVARRDHALADGGALSEIVEMDERGGFVALLLFQEHDGQQVAMQFGEDERLVYQSLAAAKGVLDEYLLEEIGHICGQPWSAPQVERRH